MSVRLVEIAVSDQFKASIKVALKRFTDDHGKRLAELGELDQDIVFLIEHAFCVGYVEGRHDELMEEN